jgi:nicotinamide riboside kinase
VKKIVYLYGGPGTGKSTTAAHLFALAKQDGFNAELVREYIKDWVWEGREIKPGDQPYIASKQSRKERICFGSLDLIISDSPMYLGQFYEEKYDTSYPVVKHLIAKHMEFADVAGYEFVHVFLKRMKEYNPAGRYQTEDEAIVCDQEIRAMMLREGVNLIDIAANEYAAHRILDIIKA